MDGGIDDLLKYDLSAESRKLISCVKSFQRGDLGDARGAVVLTVDRFLIRLTSVP